MILFIFINDVFFCSRLSNYVFQKCVFVLKTADKWQAHLTDTILYRWLLCVENNKTIICIEVRLHTPLCCLKPMKLLYLCSHSFCVFCDSNSALILSIDGVDSPWFFTLIFFFVQKTEFIFDLYWYGFLFINEMLIFTVCRNKNIFLLFQNIFANHNNWKCSKWLMYFVWFQWFCLLWIGRLNKIQQRKRTINRIQIKDLCIEYIAQYIASSIIYCFLCIWAKHSAPIG